ncbi:HIT family protein [Pedobacter antarcticus]|uniref:HIT family hydrolase n=2 Tax=Pedobacter antarcticus TaxID=34086 RepID=A0A081PGQ8_9SPHI|nr:HIT family protein [Pedobacter antarcticus]KEQ29881.1 HIT family hydrolase [Pedobacter antarcticus 4BY]SDM14688.1 histidine triad (HIT) family protein [Pedobacter antarcticus]SFF14754.1 histidine triad (HIT) family protein [Pedobacter antarcticus]
MATIFTQIADREIPAHIVAETADFLAFLDVNPLAPGHLLVIPKKEIDYIFDMDEESYFGLTLFAKIVAEGLKKAFPCVKVGMAVIGLEVPHVHIHLIPMNHVGDMNFSKPKLNPTQEELEEAAAKIRAELSDNTRG